MKLSITSLAPLLLSGLLSIGACATMETDSSTQALGSDPTDDMGEANCGTTAYEWTGPKAEWPIETVAIGDQVFSQDSFGDFLDGLDEERRQIATQIVSLQLNYALGYEISDELLELAEQAGDYVMAPDTSGLPPTISAGDEGVRKFGQLSECRVSGAGQFAQVDREPQTGSDFFPDRFHPGSAPASKPEVSDEEEDRRGGDFPSPF